MIWGFVISLLFLRSFLVSGRRRQDTGSVWVCWSSRACVWMCATRRDAPCSTWPLRRDTVAVWSCCSANQHPACSRSAVISGVLSMSQVNSTTFCCFVNIRGGALIFISMPFTVHFVMFWSRLGPRGRRAVSLSCIEMVTCFVWARCNTCLVYYHDYFHLTKGGVCVCVCVSAANGHTDCLQMLLSSEEDIDLPNVSDTEGQWVNNVSHSFWAALLHRTSRMHVYDPK